MARNLLSDITEEELTASDFEGGKNLLPEMQTQTKKPFQGAQIMKDIGNHIWDKGTNMLPNFLQGIQHIDKDMGQTYDLLKNNPELAYKIFSEEVQQSYGRMGNAPSVASQYGADRGVIPEDWAMQNIPDWLTGPQGQEPVEGEKLIRGAGNMLAHGLPAFLTGGASLPLTMAAESTGAGEGPIMPALMGKFMENLPKNIKSYSPHMTASEIAQTWRSGQKKFGKEFNNTFNYKGVPQSLNYNPDPRALQFLETNFPEYLEKTKLYLQNKTPENLNFARSEMDQLNRYLLSKGVNNVNNGSQLYSTLQTLIPEMEHHVNSALEQGSPKLPGKLAKINDRYRKEIVPIDQAMKSAIRAFESAGKEGSYGSPMSVIEASRGTPFDAFRKGYKGDIPGIDRVKTENYFKNAFRSPVALATGGLMTGMGPGAMLYNKLKGED